MKLPSLLRAHAAFAPGQTPSDHDLLAAVARHAERQGAARIVQADGALSFDAAGMAFNVSPLAAMDMAEVAVRRFPTRTQVEYGMSLELFTGAAAWVLVATVALCAYFIFRGDAAPVAIAALFYLGGVAGSYFFYSNRMNALIREAVGPALPAVRGAGLSREPAAS